VIVPELPGALSAFGILVSDVVKDYSRTVVWRVANELPIAKMKAEFAALRNNADRDLRQERWRGAIRYRRTIDLRYRGQGYELNIDYTPALLEDFRKEHQRRYGYDYPGREIEIVTLRLRAIINSPPIGTGTAHHESNNGEKRRKRDRVALEYRPVFLAGKKRQAAIYERARLAIGKRQFGPAVITEYSATTVVPPGMSFQVVRTGNLLIETGRARKG
jgi:N-methylhydantoinase A